MVDHQKYNVIIFCFCIVCFCIVISVIFLSDAGYTVRFEMDDNTSNYLNEHDYCFFTEQTSYDSSEPSIIFVGDCQYLNTTILKVS